MYDVASIVFRRHKDPTEDCSPAYVKKEMQPVFNMLVLEATAWLVERMMSQGKTDWRRIKNPPALLGNPEQVVARALPVEEDKLAYLRALLDIHYRQNQLTTTATDTSRIMCWNARPRVISFAQIVWKMRLLLTSSHSMCVNQSGRAMHWQTDK